jgi:hypothetical protein
MPPCSKDAHQYRATVFSNHQTLHEHLSYTAKLSRRNPSLPTPLVTRRAHAAAQRAQGRVGDNHVEPERRVPPQARQNTPESSPEPTRTAMPLFSTPKISVARVEQDGPSRIPIMTEGDPTPQAMRDFENGCLDYFGNKDIDEDKQTARILPGFKDAHIRNHINVDRARITALPFAAFMEEIRSLFLAPNWEEDLRRELMSAVMGTVPFWDYAAAIQNINILLAGTDSHLAEDKLRHQIEVEMTDRLSKRCKTEKIQNVIGLRAWLLEVKRIDDGMRAERQEFEEIARTTRYESRKSNYLSEPSRHANTPSNGGASSSKAPATRVPKLTESERKLLYANDGCLKCRCLFVDHRMANCPNNFPDPLKYKTITQSLVDSIKARMTRKVGAIAQENTASDSSFQSTQSSHPVAALMSSSNYPIAYMPPNASAVLEGGDSSSDDSVSTSTSRKSRFRFDSRNVGALLACPKDKVEAPLFLPHFNWDCAVVGPAQEFPIVTTSLIDCGCPTVLIRNDLCLSLGLQKRKLPKPEAFDVALHDDPKKKKSIVLYEYCTITLSDPDSRWHAKTVRAIIAPSLCNSIILGLPFMAHNNIVIDVAARSAVDKLSGFDLLNPGERPSPPQVKFSPKEKRVRFQRDHKAFTRELKSALGPRKVKVEASMEKIKPINFIGVVRERIEILAAVERLQELGETIKKDFKEVFEAIPHVEHLPSDIYCRIKRKDASRTIVSRSYACPRKYRDAWAVLIQEHVDAGRIRPSSSEHASPAFLVPKSDPTALPRWVNDYRQLNANTVTDSHPLPRVDDILADCAKGKIWSKIDMTNSFFQTRMHPDDIPLTAVTTPLGLWEWTVMPMGLRNAPSIHQRRMMTALRPFLGKFCHVYIDDIVIWSNSVEEHDHHVRAIMQALKDAKLYCNPKKCSFFLLELDFLGHHISA